MYCDSDVVFSDADSVLSLFQLRRIVCFDSVMVVVAFSLHARIMGEGLTNQSPVCAF